MFKEQLDPQQKTLSKKVSHHIYVTFHDVEIQENNSELFFNTVMWNHVSDLYFSDEMKMEIGPVCWKISSFNK